MSEAQNPVATEERDGDNGEERQLQPPQHWADLPLPAQDNDHDSTLGDDASTTASITSSILQYRTINRRTYHSDLGGREANQYW